ncbi:hypothetical protein ACFL4L_02150 [bacterium]
MSGKIITVNGKNYQWTAIQTNSGYIVTVQSLFISGQKLRVKELPLLSQDMRTGDIESDVSYQYNIKDMIETALRRGWQPYAEGLPDFVI